MVVQIFWLTTMSAAAAVTTRLAKSTWFTDLVDYSFFNSSTRFWDSSFPKKNFSLFTGQFWRNSQKKSLLFKLGKSAHCPITVISPGGDHKSRTDNFTVPESS